MKKIIEIGVDDVKLKLFIGEKGRESFFKEIDVLEKEENYKITIDDDCRELAQGLQVLNMIFVVDWNRKVLLHELQHFMDYLFEELTIVEEREAKAIFMSNVVEKVLTIRDKEIINNASRN